MKHNIHHMSEMGRLHGMRGGFSPVILIPLLAILIANYVLKSIALYRLAKNRELDNPWVAWIPIVHNCLIGELTGDRMWNFGGSKFVLSIVPFVIIACMLIPKFGIFIALPLTIVFAVYYYMCLYRLFATYKPESADLYIITSIFIPILGSIWMFVIRNEAPVNYKYLVNKKAAVQSVTTSNPEEKDEI